MSTYPWRAPCVRPGCGHSSDVHSFDEAQNGGCGVSDEGAKFRCQVCGVSGCPDMVRSKQNLKDIKAAI